VFKRKGEKLFQLNQDALRKNVFLLERRLNAKKGAKRKEGN